MLYVGGELATSLEVASVNPNGEMMKFQQLDEEVDEIIVVRAMGNEHASHSMPFLEIVLSNGTASLGVARRS
jgi:hypothetical protein